MSSEEARAVNANRLGQRATTDPGPKPRAVAVAQVGIWLQPFTFVCCGFAPALLTIPTFGFYTFWAIAVLLPEALHLVLVWLVFVPSLAYVILFNVWITRRIEERRRWAATTATVLSASAALWATGFCVYLAAIEGFDLLWTAYTFGTAIPCLAAQAMTVIGLQTPAARRWRGGVGHDSDGSTVRAVASQP
ncbi:hypothetical protein [Glycomyces sp. NPDC048151]|uniref:hypothetical protein n=1 Tax=Glycomyces sp. NPDC048151 TaxID=3364002 RepID=UPI0037199E57